MKKNILFLMLLFTLPIACSTSNDIAALAINGGCYNHPVSNLNCPYCVRNLQCFLLILQALKDLRSALEQAKKSSQNVLSLSRLFHSNSTYGCENHQIPLPRCPACRQKFETLGIPMPYNDGPCDSFLPSGR